MQKQPGHSQSLKIILSYMSTRGLLKLCMCMQIHRNSLSMILFFGYPFITKSAFLSLLFSSFKLLQEFFLSLTLSRDILSGTIQAPRLCYCGWSKLKSQKVATPKRRRYFISYSLPFQFLLIQRTNKLPVSLLILINKITQSSLYNHFCNSYE